MAYLGVQYATPEPPAVVTAALAELLASAHGIDGPDHRDQARYVDEAGYHTTLNILYWTDPEDFDAGATTTSRGRAHSTGQLRRAFSAKWSGRSPGASRRCSQRPHRGRVRRVGAAQR